MIERSALRFEAPLLEGVELPCVEARGRRDGPRVCLIAGIHGCEYASIAALIRFLRSLDAERLSGSLMAVPIVNVTAFRARSPFVTPQDGKNLNRCFPGDPDGTFSDVLAHHLFEARAVEAHQHPHELLGGVRHLRPTGLGDAVEELLDAVREPGGVQIRARHVRSC